MAEPRVLRLALGSALLALVACGGAGSRAYRSGLDAWERETAAGEARATSSALPADDPQRPGAHSGLADLLAWALVHNPGVRAAAARWRAALERVPVASALPDPRLELGYFLEEIETRTGPQDWRVGLRQPFPWFGTLDAAGRAAAAEAEAARAEFLAERLAVEQEVRDAWHELAWAHAAAGVARAHRDLLARWEVSARTRYANGLADEFDVVRAQVELGRLDERVRRLDDLLRPLRARLNGALDRPPGAPLPTPEAEAPEATTLEPEDLAAVLETHSPTLLVARAAIDAAQERVTLADKRGMPDFSLGLDYVSIGSARNPGTPGSGDDALALTAGLELPLWRGAVSADRRRAASTLEAARAEYAHRLNTQRTELELALYTWRDAWRRLELYAESLAPKARESVEVTAAAYSAGDADFLELVDAERTLLEFELAVVRARADAAQALARLERLTGTPLTLEESP